MKHIVDVNEPLNELLLPDPPVQEIHYPLISVDDHLVEPPWLFEGRLPKALQDRAPKVFEDDKGNMAWHFDGEVYRKLGMNAMVGRSDRDDFTMEPARFSDIRPGSFDIHSRIKDQDIAGIWASMCFPSLISGFCGRIYSNCSDPELGIATMRAFNDWIYEEWWQSYPERIIPMGITWLRDQKEAIAEIERNAERGFVAVSLPEQPSSIDLESLHSGWWDPIIQACVETDTKICLHIGSSGNLVPQDKAGPTVGMGATKFQIQAYSACAEWIWSQIPLRFPDVKLVFSEGGIGWMPVMYDRLKHQIEISGHGRQTWPTDGLGPHEVLLKNCYFCSINDPSTIDGALALASDHIMIETDYPHADSTWPDSQEHIKNMLGHLDAATIENLTYRNAAKLFSHPLPNFG